MRVDAGGRLAYVNRASEKVLGIGPEECIGRLARDFIHPDDLQGNADAFFKMIGDRVASATLENRIIGRAGDVHDISWTVNLHRDRRGNVVGVNAIGKDVTRLRRAEEALRRSVDDFRTIVAKNADGMIVLDGDGRVRYINPAAEALFGMPAAEMIGQDFGFPIVLAEPVEMYILREFRSFVAVEMRLAEVEWAGEPSYLISFRDLTDRIIAEQATCEARDRLEAVARERAAELKSLEEKSSNLIKHAPTGIYEIDFHGPRLKSVNDTMCRYLGYAREELLALNPLDLMDDESARTFRDRIREQLSGKPVDDSVVYWIRAKDGREICAALNVTFTYRDGRPDGAMVIAHDVTERHRTEEALRESEEKFKALAETSPAAILVYQDERYVYVNPAAERVTGYRADELLAMKFWDIMHPDDLAMVRERGKARLRGEAVPSRYEVRHRTKDGRDGFLEINASTMYYHGRLAGLITALDVTERKRAEEALRQTLRQLKAETECIGAVIHAEAEEALLQSVCRTIVEVGGYRMAWIGKKGPGFEVRPAASYGMEEGYLAKVRVRWDDSEYGQGPTGMAIKTGEAQVMRDIPGDPAYRPWARDALARGYRSSVALPLITAGGVIGALNVYSADPNAFTEQEDVLLKDIAANLAFGIHSLRQRYERQQAEEALRASEEKYRELVESSNSIILRVDRDARITFMNDFALRFFGYGEEEVIGKSAMGTIVPAIDAAGRDLAAMAEDILRHPENYKTNTHQNMRKNGELVWVSWTNKAVLDDGGNLVEIHSVGNDITALKQAEEELKSANAQAELYLDVMGHDINNMHQVALGYLELMEGMEENEALKEYLERPRDVLLRSARLIDNVRKLQKLREGAYRSGPVELVGALADVLAEYGEVPGKTLTLDTHGIRSGYVQANELLYDVFSNLVSNAIKHSGTHAEVIIDLDRVRENGGAFYRVSVEDNGPGIADSFKEKVFNRLLRGDTQAKGMGLGLYIVKTLVGSYNGRVWVEDRVPGDHARGAKFVVLLPALQKK